jgi:hypothetical protein
MEYGLPPATSASSQAEYGLPESDDDGAEPRAEPRVGDLPHAKVNPMKLRTDAASYPNGAWHGTCWARFSARG